jgi:hypothetical protein
MKVPADAALAAVVGHDRLIVVAAQIAVIAFGPTKVPDTRFRQ